MTGYFAYVQLVVFLYTSLLHIDIQFEKSSRRP